MTVDVDIAPTQEAIPTSKRDKDKAEERYRQDVHSCLIHVVPTCFSSPAYWYLATGRCSNRLACWDAHALEHGEIRGVISVWGWMTKKTMELRSGLRSEENETIEAGGSTAIAIDLPPYHV